MTNDEAPKYPPTIFYGTKPLEIRFRSRGTRQTFYCLNNFTLHLSEKLFRRDGTFSVATFLGSLCAKHCRSVRESGAQPCPAFLEDYEVAADKGLASVKLRALPRFELCGGVRTLLDEIEMTREERFLFLAYHEDKYGDEGNWRDAVVEAWNEGWSQIEEGWDSTSRRGRFDHMLWMTIRFPALIPQVWLNWLHAASEQEQRMLDENPSRIDFMAFAGGDRYVVEVDGPSHYAAYDEVTRTYTVDEREYARNLKVARSLQRDGWVLTRIGRSEVRDAMADRDTEAIDSFFETWKLLRILPFHAKEYPEQYTVAQLGVPELTAPSFSSADDDIPF
jgi:very-short-patch-repair endonuclease